MLSEKVARSRKKTLLGIGLFGGGFGGLLRLKVIFNHKKAETLFYVDIPSEYRNLEISLIIVYGLESRVHGETKNVFILMFGLHFLVR